MIRVKPISFPSLANSSWFRLRVCPVLLRKPHYLSNKLFIPSWYMNDIANNNKPNFVFMVGLPKQMWNCLQPPTIKDLPGSWKQLKKKKNVTSVYLKLKKIAVFLFNNYYVFGNIFMSSNVLCLEKNYYWRSVWQLKKKNRLISFRAIT